MIDCSKCNQKCCGQSPVNAPVLFPFEWLKYYGSLVDEGQFKRLARKEDNSCVFYKDNICTIYEDRPFECRMYPYIFTFKDNKVDLELHDGCPQKDSACKKPNIPVEVLVLSNRWWLEWNKLSV